MSSVRERNDCTDGESDKLKGIAKLFADHIFSSKENIDENLVSLENGSENSRANFEKILSRFPELQSVFKNLLSEGTLKPSDLKSMPLEELPVHEEDQSSRSLSHKTKCNHKRLLKTQEKELAVLKNLFIKTKQDFKEFQVYLQRDLMELGNQMQEMSSAAQGYYKVVEENRKLYNMVQDLKGRKQLTQVLLF
jgi:kinesin family protein C2/C3